MACLQEALKEIEIDAIDAALARLQALPVTGRTHIAISEIANFILLGEFQKAAESVIGLRRQSDVPKSGDGQTQL
ncbi:MAG: hypothetical protein LBC55_07545 [Desulfovibrio sp.]|nr:hypothetical protein [Desulfovibrio sp.]